MPSFFKKILKGPVIALATVGMVVGGAVGVPYAGVDAAIGAVRGKPVFDYHGFKHTVLSGAEDAGSLFADVGGWHGNSVGTQVQRDYVAPTINKTARLVKAQPKPGAAINGVDCRGTVPGTNEELAGFHASWGMKGPTQVLNHFYPKSGPFQVGFTYVELPAGSCTGGDVAAIPSSASSIVTPSRGIVDAMVPPPN